MPRARRERSGAAQRAGGRGDDPPGGHLRSRWSAPAACSIRHLPGPKRQGFPLPMATFHPGNFGIASTVDVAIMQHRALITSPLPQAHPTVSGGLAGMHPQPSTFGNCTARNDAHHTACRNRFVRRDAAEHRPAAAGLPRFRLGVLRVSGGKATHQIAAEDRCRPISLRRPAACVGRSSAICRAAGGALPSRP
jgi:hypothetical protein